MSNERRTVARWFLGAAITMASLLLGGPRPVAAGGPPLAHVFIVVLENKTFSVITPTSMPYLTSLGAGGVSLDQMYGVDHASLTNYVAMVSGHASNALTQADCPSYDCVYEPPDDVNLGDQLEAAGLTWKGYMESMPMPCAHGTEGDPDPYQIDYATRHNPFMYYRDIVGDQARCDAHDVPYTDLAVDLANDTVPNYALIVPNTCNDAHDGAPDCGLATADAWLAANLPPILGSAAFADRGVLIVTFDESNFADHTGCCGNSQGGHIATFVLGPLVTAPGTHSSTPYNHYSLLRTIEDGFGLSCLRHACDASISAFGAEVLTRCGNGMPDPGEDCDPGTDVAGDCCTSACLFAPASTPCADDGEICTSDACDAAGTCQHTAVGCDDGDACTTDTCSSGSGCIHTPLAGFAGTECRLDVLIADVTDSPDVDPVWRSRLLRPLSHARDNVDQASALVAAGRAPLAAVRLRFATARMNAFLRRASAAAGRGGVSQATGARIIVEGQVVIQLIAQISP